MLSERIEGLLKELNDFAVVEQDYEFIAELSTALVEEIKAAKLDVVERIRNANREKPSEGDVHYFNNLAVEAVCQIIEAEIEQEAGE
jgi:biopolymer transport protein ExbB/TolQ